MDESQRGPVHVEFRGVSKRYGQTVQAVRQLDLEIMRGEFLTLLGPSGSGKTTALMMLAGFEDTTEGEILIDGQRIDNVPANRRGIGMVFQNYALFPHMTVAENLAFPLEVRKLGREQVTRRVRNVLDMVQLPEFGNRRPAQLSGGQQQRVAVARALIFEPNLVLMDEPLGALDKQLREQMQFEIKDIHARLGVTFVYVTHDQTEALTMSDRIAVFSAGRIEQLSTPRELYERPAASFVASFIGESNRMSGTVLTGGENGGVAVHLDDSDVVLNAMSYGATLSAGARVTLSIRPERMSMLQDGATALNVIAATVVQSVYVGDHIRLVAVTASGLKFIVKLAASSSQLELNAGEAVRLGCGREDCLALDR
ncbi:ABC transporter ATP-binding protein [Mesorhizobium mediterraneum]|uniref:Spermidine/putrescine import ATP-binding protein PotA n=1 Tax=Mesorhizobium mediterraneum TaxID=43617 RepID=A0AB36R8S8_9HYPH|nr:ABC transporter ATP-binding protein [Mesorhizobium mediterraneum]RWN40968.1 MAG: ABC transporter ATP-binding protein [Mesorhizobium sp.]PAQ00943.1 spermidine/putrescine ABC transporter ATP-binding protein [Mesorhizobium mediterraneum]RWQ36217.1 MAG: ABC transporter ATP-binding protein [Mesorhizobium sp.]TIT39760.1 MAG: ABC transporter ATP-binding protein [Mesorhizobium sp.]WIW52277.1 ABC transporter ATP-binding protein [Mesorhizobium mediterraneum]